MELTKIDSIDDLILDYLYQLNITEKYNIMIKEFNSLRWFRSIRGWKYIIIIFYKNDSNVYSNCKYF